MNQQIKTKSLPIVEDDVIFKIDPNDRQIKLGTVLIGEINHLPNSASIDDDQILCMWHSNYEKQSISRSQVNVLENRCDLGMGVCCMINSDKYGVCVKKKTIATCVVLDENSKERNYLLNIDTERLQSYSNMNYDLCFFKNSIYEVSDINYSIQLNYQNKISIEIETSRRNFMKRFLVLDDAFNKNFPKDKQIELNYVNGSPFSFDEIIGKLVTIQRSELLKFKNKSELKQLFELINLVENDNIKLIEKSQDDNMKEIYDTINDKNSMVKENESFESICGFKVQSDTSISKTKSANSEMQINFAIKDVKIFEVILNVIKEFTGVNTDQDFKSEKIKFEQLKDVKFFRVNDDKHISLGSRMKLELNERDNFVKFREYQQHLDANVKAKISKLPKRKFSDLKIADYVEKDLTSSASLNFTLESSARKFEKRDDLTLDDYKLEVNDCYEKETTVENLFRSNSENENKSTSSKLNSSFVIIESLGEDDVFVDENQLSDKKLSKEEIKNQNLRMLSRLNRRSRNTSARASGLMNSSFKKVKIDSTGEDCEEQKKELATKQQINVENLMINNNKTVLVDILYVDTFVDVHWQDNTIETDIPLSMVNEEIDNLIQKYYPGNFVEYNNEMKSDLDPTYGVIQKVNQKANIAEVKWFFESIGDTKDEVNNNRKSRTWITHESLFNLRSSCIHFHLNDIVVDHNLITDSSKISIEDIPRLIGTIQSIGVDGTAFISWINGTESWKKLVELVSFFDVEFSDYSDDEYDDENSLFSLTMDSKENFDTSFSDSMKKLDEKDKNFTDNYKFNKIKFECTTNDLKCTIDENKFKEKWLEKIEKLSSLVSEFKTVQLDQLNKQKCSYLNEENDKKIVDIVFEMINCYLSKIKNHITGFKMISELNIFDDFYLQLVFSLNNWLDFIQTNFYHLFILFEDNAKFRSIKLSSLEKLKSKSIDEELLCIDLIDLCFKKQNLNDDYQKKMITIINKFNDEVTNRIELNKIQILDDNSNDNENTNSSLSSISDIVKSIGNKCSLLDFKKLECVSIEEGKIKHEFMKSNQNIQKESNKVDLSTLRKELNLLNNNLPDGIYFKTFEERLDLMSLMIEGSKNTVYENHVFLFDLKIKDKFLNQPPQVSYLSFYKQINPNLYSTGNVCLSLLNTFGSKFDNEKWTSNSSLLQLAISLQALVLNATPFYNEADFDVYQHTEEGYKKAKMYNEYVICSLINYSIDLMDKRNNLAFKNEIQQFYQTNASTIYKRYHDFLVISMSWNSKMKNTNLSDDVIDEKFKEMIQKDYPEFECASYPLLPASEGFCLTLAKNLNLFTSYFKDYLPSIQIENDRKQIESLISSIQI